MSSPPSVPVPPPPPPPSIASPTVTTSSSMNSQQQQQQQQQQAPPSPPDADNDPRHMISSSSYNQSTPSSSTSASAVTTVTKSWTQFTQLIHTCISKVVLTLSLTAARNPKRCIGLVSIISILLIGIGFATNFELSLDDEAIYAPNGCRPLEHWNYVINVEGYPNPKRPLIVVVHADGGNVMDNAYDGVDLIFQANDLARNLPDYDNLCSLGDCQLLGTTRYWDHNRTLFQSQSNYGNNQKVIETLSEDQYYASQSYVLGNYEKEYYPETNTTLITYAESFFSVLEFPAGDNGEAQAFELKVIDLLMELRESLLQQSETSSSLSPLRLEFYTWRTVTDEMTRAVTSDLPLIPFVFVIMTCFTCFIFWRRDDKVQSRALLGIGSVITIVLSVMSGFGLAFIIGLPFTSMTQILPFVIFGVGLDDTFIITGAYFRTDPTLPPVERIRHTMEEVGASISLTTTTTVIAFIMGCLSSSIPCIQWICLYAFPTILIDFIYQITFFVAVLVLDEYRIQDNRRDCCVWVQVEPDPEDDGELNGDTNAHRTPPASQAQNVDGDDHEVVKPKLPMTTDRIMEVYSSYLLLPRVKVAVLVAFTIFVAGCVYSATLLEQDFKPADFLPDGSYAYAFIDASNRYTTNSLQIKTYFRDVNQSDPDIQAQMVDYINDMSALPQIQKQPDFCWVRDFQQMKDGSNPAFEPYSFLFDPIFNSNLTMSEQVHRMLEIPQIYELYGRDIAFDEDGNIESSRCTFSVNGVDLDIVTEQIEMLADQRAVAEAQPINEGREDFAFFMVDKLFYIWEFYTVAVYELIFTTVSGVVAVSLITFILIPHRTAVMFVLPLMMILYVQLLGALQLAGLAINPLTYICLVMSIGLLVDFVLHLILRYYESTETTRDGKVKDTLKTMGSSIFVGGLSTLLGVVPLAFSSSGVIGTVFIMFFAMVSLGLANGLILLPVILSYVGPTVSVRMNHQPKAKPPNNNETGISSDDYLDVQTTGSSSSEEICGPPSPCSETTLSQSPCASIALPSMSSASPSVSQQSTGHNRPLVHRDGAWRHIFDDMIEIEV